MYHASAVGLIQQLLCSPIGNCNFRNISKQNITTEQTPYSIGKCQKSKLAVLVCPTPINNPLSKRRIDEFVICFALHLSLMEVLTPYVRIANFRSSAVIIQI